MSNAVFPANQPGLQWDIKKTPIFSTLVQESVSGRETRVALQEFPRWKYSLSYELLRSDTISKASGYGYNAYNELQTILSFFLLRKGSFDTFLYSDPEDSSVVGQQIGVGDGVTAAYQLVRAIGGFIEPCRDIKGTPVIYVNGFPYDVGWTLGPTGIITIDPANIIVGPNLVANGNFDGDASGWTGTDCTLASVANGESGNCLRLTATGNTVQYAVQTIPTTVGKWYRYKAWVKSGSSGDELGRLRLYAPGTLDPHDTFFTSSGTWTAYTLLWQALYNSYSIQLRKNSATLGTMFFDTTSVFEVTPGIPANGVPVAADFSYFQRVRFQDDQTEFSNFAAKMWEAKKIEFISVKY